MKITELQQLTKAPVRGQYLVYMRKAVEFGHYDSAEYLDQKFKDTDLLELHLFDKDKEYRAISSESYYHESGQIEYLSEFPINAETCLLETVQLEEEKGTITVANHVSYNADGMAFVDDYRLIPGGEK